MKTVLAIIFVGFSIPLFMFMMKLVGDLLSMDSDAAVIGGYFLMMIVVAIFIIGVNEMYKKIKGEDHE